MCWFCFYNLSDWNSRVGLALLDWDCCIGGVVLVLLYLDSYNGRVIIVIFQ